MITKCKMPNGDPGFACEAGGTCYATREEAEAAMEKKGGYKTDSLQMIDSYTPEHFVIDATRRKTSDGYMVAFAKVARTGIQNYKGSELGKPSMKEVRVYRPESEVFHEDSMNSYAHKPITRDHPGDYVTSKTWKEHAGGSVGDKVVRDGNFVSVPILLMDQKIIDAVEKHGVKELSVGYGMDLTWHPGKTESGDAYDAIMSNIRVNHLAVVPAARGGKELRIGDENDDDNKRKEKPMGKRILVDGVAVDGLEEMQAQVIERQLTKDATTIADLTAKVEKLTTDATAVKATNDAASIEAKKAIDTKDGEIVILKKQVEDAKITPAALDKLVKDRSIVIQKAVGFLGDKFPYAEKTEAEIMRASVAKKVGDEAAKAMNEDAIVGGFNLMTVDVKIGDGVRSLADALTSHNQNRQLNDGDAAAARQKAFDESTEALANAWKPKAA